MIRITDDIVVGHGLKVTPTLFAGPCQIESEQHALMMSSLLRHIAEGAGFQFVYKSSFDKANRTSAGTARGPGLIPGLSILQSVKNTGIPVMTDVHEVSQVDVVGFHVDVIQIPALLSRQTDLIQGAAATGRAINIKKGQGMSAQTAISAAHKVNDPSRVMLCERGTTFGYGDLVVDFRSLVDMRKAFPVMFDATHSVQRPSAQGAVSGGAREYVGPLAAAAAAVGIDALFLEVHQDPDNAPSDGPCMLHLNDLKSVLDRVRKISRG